MPAYHDCILSKPSIILVLCVLVLMSTFVTSDLAWQTSAGGVNHDFNSKARGLELEKSGRLITPAYSCIAKTVTPFSDVLIGDPNWSALYTSLDDGTTFNVQARWPTCPASGSRVFAGRPFSMAMTPALGSFVLLTSLNQENSTLNFQLLNRYNDAYSAPPVPLPQNETVEPQGEETEGEEVEVEVEEGEERDGQRPLLRSVFVCSQLALIELKVNSSRFHFLFSFNLQGGSYFLKARSIPTLPFSIKDIMAYTIFPVTKSIPFFNDTVCSFNIATLQLLTESEKATVSSWQVQVSSSLASHSTHMWTTQLDVNSTSADDGNTTSSLRRQIMYHSALRMMMVLTGDGQVNILKPDNGTLIQSSLTFSSPFQMAGSRGYFFWVIDSVGLQRVTYNSYFETFSSRLVKRNNEQFTSLVLDREGYLYLTTANELYIITPQSTVALSWKEKDLSFAVPTGESSVILLSNSRRQLSVLTWSTTTPTSAPTPYWPTPYFPPYHPPTEYYTPASRSTLYIVISVLGAVALILKLTYLACRRRGATSTSTSTSGADYVRIENGNDVYSPLSPPPEENQSSPPSSSSPTMPPPEYNFVVDPARLLKSPSPSDPPSSK